MPCGTYSKGTAGQPLRKWSKIEGCIGPQAVASGRGETSHTENAAALDNQRHATGSMQLDSPIPARLVGAVGAATESGLQHTASPHLSASVVKCSWQAGA